MSIKLKDLIRQVRSADSTAEEREVIQTELAAIRSKFAANDTEMRHRNVAKLLFIQMRGFNTQFAQLECIKLVASERFGDKRIGYLGLMLLLDEQSEVLMLVTNSIKIDLNSSNMYIVGLALCALGNLATADMARDLAGDVEKLLGSSNPYVRKKAALCAKRIIKKCPDLLENFLGRAQTLAVDRHHGVLLSGITLMLEMCAVDSTVIPQLRQLVPALVRSLKTLATAGFSPEHDVGGLSDPFVQVKIIRLLRVLGAGDATASEAMSDALAQVATNVDTAKNVGNAILYETVQTIMAIVAEPGLRLLAVNILGRFLLNKDNNIRYVALVTLSRVSEADSQAVQRHRSTITACLKDADVSIRKRALELVYLLVNPRNAAELLTELTMYVDVIDEQFRGSLVANILALARKFTQGSRWHVSLVLSLLKVGGAHMRPESVDDVIALLGQLEDEYAFGVHELYAALEDNMASEALKRVGSWAIGEFGDLLGKPSPSGAAGVSDGAILDLFERVLSHLATDNTTRAFVLTALAKLGTRLAPSAHPRVAGLLREYRDSAVTEIQQHACEYEIVLALTDLRDGLLERMPALALVTPDAEQPAVDSTAAAVRKSAPVGLLLDDELEAAPAPGAAPVATAAPRSSGAAGLLDLMSGGLGTSGHGAGAPPPSGGSGVASLLDLLGGGSSGSGAPAPVVSPSALAPTSGAGALASLLGGATPVAAPAAVPVVIYSRNLVQVKFTYSKTPDAPAVTNILASFSNGNAMPLPDLLFQLAVPAYLTVRMLPASATVLPAGSTDAVTQAIQVLNNQHGAAPLAFRYQISFTANGAPFVDQGDVPSVPAGL